MTRSLRRIASIVSGLALLLFNATSVALAQDPAEGGNTEGPSPFNGYALTLLMMGLILFIMAKSARR